MKPSILVGLIGANIQKSLAPALFEEACGVAGMRGHYHLMDFDQLPGRSLGSLMEAVQRAGFAGVNVTYPCKEAVVPLLDEASPEARQIGAVNTVTIGRDGRTVGYNTDRIGFRRAFEDTFGRDACHSTPNTCFLGLEAQPLFYGSSGSAGGFRSCRHRHARAPHSAQPSRQPSRASRSQQANGWQARVGIVADPAETVLSGRPCQRADRHRAHQCGADKIP